MEGHLSHSLLVRLFSGKASLAAASAMAHATGCRRCRELAAATVAELKRAGTLVRSADARGALLTLLEGVEQQTLGRMQARARWAELKGLSRGEQLKRLRSTASLQAPEMVDAILEDAAACAQSDPYLGKETALVAHALAGLLPSHCWPPEDKNDLQGKAMLVVANCCRLRVDWPGASAAVKAARGHFDLGTGEPTHGARLLSIQASLATDTGNLEQALALLAHASQIHREECDEPGRAHVMVKEASTLLAACRFEEAFARAEEALRLLSPQDTRLEMLARSIVTESLALLERPDEALHSLAAARPLYEQFSERPVELRIEYLEAVVLDASDRDRDSEKAYRHVIAGFMESELYKEVFVALLMLFKSLVRREAFDKAAQVCEEALEKIEEAGTGCHAQAADVWRTLLTLVNTRRLTDHHVRAAQQYLARHWGAPSSYPPLEPPRRDEPLAVEGDLFKVLRWDANGTGLSPETPAMEAEPEDRQPLATLDLSPPAGPLAPGDYDATIDRIDRELVAQGLAQCRGNITATSNLLGIARYTLREKMKKYGLRKSWFGCGAG